MSGRIEGIFLWPVSKGDPVPVQSVVAISGRGLDGDRKRGKKRQLTLLSAEDWAEATREAGAVAEPMWRRANLVLRGIKLGPDAIGRRVALGEVVLKLRGETQPCHRMDDLHPGLRKALEPDFRGGVYGSVERGGQLRVGDLVALL